MARKIIRTELLGVPEYRQGAHDRLCVYYSAAMLFETAHPELAHRLGGTLAGRTDDPILGNYGRSTKVTTEAKLADWFHKGARVTVVKEALNRAMKKEELGTRFKFEELPVSGAYERIRESVGEGFPVVLGWDTEDIGHHAVLVIGWEVRKKDKWLILHDPGSGHTERSLQQLERLSDHPKALDVLWLDPKTYKGPRPDRLVHDEDGWSIERWWPDASGDCDWRERDELFESACRGTADAQS